MAAKEKSFDATTSSQLLKDCGSIPTNITMKTERGCAMNINIGKINGSISVGNKNVVNHYYADSDSGTGKRRYGPKQSDGVGVGQFVCDTDSSSSDDSEAEVFFDGCGVQKSTLEFFRKVKRDKKNSKLNTKPVNRNIHTIIINGKQPPAAFDCNGRPMAMPASSNAPYHTRVPGPKETATNKQHLQPQQASCQPATPADYTILEKYEQKFQNAVKQFNLPQKSVTESDLLKISSYFSTGWRRVFRHLGFSDAVIDMEYQDCDAIQDTAYRLLVKWTQQCSTPDMKTLIKALVRADQDVVLKALITAQQNTVHVECS